MNRLLLLAVLLAGCDDVVEPTLAPAYFLSLINGDPLPATPTGWTPDQRVEAATLAFDLVHRPHEGDRGNAFYTLIVNGQTTRTEHRYRVEDGILHVDLCPVGAFCGAVSTELVGPIGAGGMNLAYSIGASATSVFQFVAVLPD